MKRQKMLISTAVAAVLAGWLIWGNCALMTSEYTIAGSQLPAGFEGFRIAQISDLHNASFGRENRKLLQALENCNPDLIVLTGDLIDCRNLKLDVAISFAEQAVKIAPCCYVAGNHESRIPELPELLTGLENAGVTILRNARVPLERNGDTVTLLGVDDPAFRSHYLTGDPGPVMEDALKELVSEDPGYTILLSHRPEWFEMYRDYGVDLVFSGHAHGGQFRLPFVGGVIAPNQGFFPKYDDGVYADGGISMVVSRGLGASIIPLRINNRPEIVVAELHRQEE